MIIKVTDIPPEGREIDFALEQSDLNDRVTLAGEREAGAGTPPPPYAFVPPLHVWLRLELEGSTVIARGKAVARFRTPCARCAEETEKELAIPVTMILKPRTVRGPDAAHDEDVNFGYYDGQEVNCGSFVEELLIIALPFTALCTETCRGLCQKCGANLNVEECGCPKEGHDERFALLRGLKVNEDGPFKH